VHSSNFGKDDYNPVALAPPGTKVVAHTDADKHTSFAPYGKLYWYIGLHQNATTATTSIF